MKAAVAVVDSGGVQWNISEVPKPEPGVRQVLIKVHAASLNRGESLLMLDQIASGLPAKPRVGGLDAAGVVVATGADVPPHLSVGARVAGRCAGGFAEYALLNADDAFLIPAGMPAAQAACLPVSYVVAHEAVMRRGAAGALSSVLVTGVASGVGVAALLIAKHLGAKVIGTSGASSKLEKLKGRGLDVGIETRAPDFAKSVLEATDGRGADVVVDNVGGAFLNENVAALAAGGRLAAVGRMGGLIKPVFDLDRFAEKRIVMFGLSYRLRTPAQKAEALRHFVNDLGTPLAERQIVPLIDREFEFGDVAEAHAHLAADRHVGKIVLQVARD